MKILQLIDSLHPGGAERMAVTLANGLAEHSGVSFLCTTRAEGFLKDMLNEEVGYLFLKKQKTLDISALLKMRKFVRMNKIEVVHAHGTSFFFPTLLKLIYPKIKVIWHEHHGNRIYTNAKENKTLLKCSRYFSAIITVNDELKKWAKDNLRTKSIHYLPNFVDVSAFQQTSVKRNNTIVCLANLRAPKNHINLLKGFAIASAKYPDWHLKLVGKDFNDAYSKNVKDAVEQLKLMDSVTIIGSSGDVIPYLMSAKIGVLSSDVEGLPVALLEYGAARLAVVTTDVGQCGEVVGNNGYLIAPKNPEALANALITYMGDENKRDNDAQEFNKSIVEHYSDKAILPKLKQIYKSTFHY